LLDIGAVFTNFKVMAGRLRPYVLRGGNGSGSIVVLKRRTLQLIERRHSCSSSRRDKRDKRRYQFFSMSSRFHVRLVQKRAAEEVKIPPAKKMKTSVQKPSKEKPHAPVPEKDVQLNAVEDVQMSTEQNVKLSAEPSGDLAKSATKPTEISAKAVKKPPAQESKNTVFVLNLPWKVVAVFSFPVWSS
jgi:hypothetical protein